MKISKKVHLPQLLWLSLVIILGGFFRFYKLDWGEGYFFHPDEYHISAAVERLSFPGEMNPKLFSYGSFSVYLIYFSRLLAAFFMPSLASVNPIFIGRFFSALFSTLTIFLIFLISKEVFAKPVYQLLATSLVALTPGLIQQAHFATPESTLTFWLFLTLTFWLKFMQKENYPALFLSAISLGIASGTKIIAVSFIPVFFLLFMVRFNLFSIKKSLKRILVFLVLMIVLFIAFFSVFPYSILDWESFRGSMKYETGVGRGDPIVFYTRQFVETPAFVFHFQKILIYALGPTILGLGSVGLILLSVESFLGIIRSRKTVPLNLALVVVAFFAIFLPNGFLFAKWTRFIAPSFPFWSIFATYLLARLGNLFGESKFFLSFLRIFLFLVLFSVYLWSLMVFSIYLRHDERIAATSWIKQNLPEGSFILTEAGNMLEAPLSGNFQKTSFDFYHLEEEVERQRELPNLISEADFFIVQSRRIFVTHHRLANQFPKTNRFYELLFSGQLGFRHLKTFDSYPELRFFGWSFKVPDEQAEETWSVFDHPVIRIYQKIKPYTEEEYEKFLKI